MIQELKTTLLSLVTLFMFAVPLTAVAGAQTTQGNINDAVKCGTNIQLDKTSGCTTQDNTDLTAKVKQLINILSVVVGAVAVIMIIFGGFRYVASGGSDSAVSSAKNTILYAVIGLIIVALAQVIVHFVLNSIG